MAQTIRSASSHTFCSRHRDQTFDFSTNTGPIIRINPTELHISDPRFHEVAYASNSDFDKLEAWRDRFGIPMNITSTVEHDLHHRRRTALNPYFSKQQVAYITPHLRRCVSKLCDRLLSEYKGTSKVVTINEAYAALVTDVITQFCFGWSSDFLGYQDFVAPFTTSLRALLLSTHVAVNFPWFRKLMQSLPEALVSIVNPLFIPVFQFQNVRIRLIIWRKGFSIIDDSNGQKMKSCVNEIIEAKDNDKDDAIGQKTIFGAILSSDLSPQEKSTAHLYDEAVALVGAGIETTKSALSMATFYILDNPQIHKRLQEELRVHIPDSTNIPTLPELERLPYLTAIIRECKFKTNAAHLHLRLLWNSRLTRPNSSPPHPGRRSTPASRFSQQTSSL